MTVSLQNVTRAVDGIPTIRDISLTLERGTLSVLLGPTLCAEAFGGDGLPAIHQLPFADGL
jgi:hypothetical protein